MHRPRYACMLLPARIHNNLTTYMEIEKLILQPEGMEITNDSPEAQALFGNNRFFAFCISCRGID